MAGSGPTRRGWGLSNPSETFRLLILSGQRGRTSVTGRGRSGSEAGSVGELRIAGNDHAVQRLGERNVGCVVCRDVAPELPAPWEERRRWIDEDQEHKQIGQGVAGLACGDRSAGGMSAQDGEHPTLRRSGAARTWPRMVEPFRVSVPFARCSIRAMTSSTVGVVATLTSCAYR